MRREWLDAGNTNRTTSSSALTIEVRISQTRQACWRYAWDREQAQLRLSGIQEAQVDLPADLALLRLEELAEIPAYVLAPESIAPGTLVTVRILGAWQAVLSPAKEAEPFPLAGWILLTVPALPDLPPCYETLEQLSPALLDALHTHARSQVGTASANGDEMRLCSADEVAHAVREARLWLKRARRQQNHNQRKSARRDEEPAVSWRAIEGLTSEERAQLAQATTINQRAAFLQAEQLIRFVPTRFQKALAHLLVDDERLLAFLERPLLHHRTGWLGMHQYRANAGLLLVTDRQVLWLRDFFSPGASLFPEGYIARSVPLERLVDISLVSAGTASSSFGIVLEEDISPYLRLVLTIESSAGQERCEVAFPDDEVGEHALERIRAMLGAFVPLAGPDERRLRRLPVVEAWMPQGTEARRLADLGGVVAGSVKQRLEQHLAETLQASREELLLATVVPALEAYRSPARLVALTRAAVLTFDALSEKTRGSWKATQGEVVQERRYELSQISSAQLSYSLLGSSLRLFLPQSNGSTQELVLPFHSPAIVWFLPLFTRLRLLVSTALPQHSPEQA